jgi:hypothetical protein
MGWPTLLCLGRFHLNSCGRKMGEPSTVDHAVAGKRKWESAAAAATGTGEDLNCTQQQHHHQRRRSCSSRHDEGAAAAAARPPPAASDPSGAHPRPPRSLLPQRPRRPLLGRLRRRLPPSHLPPALPTPYQHHPRRIPILPPSHRPPSPRLRRRLVRPWGRRPRGRVCQLRLLLPARALVFCRSVHPTIIQFSSLANLGGCRTAHCVEIGTGRFLQLAPEMGHHRDVHGHRRCLDGLWRRHCGGR